MAGAIAREGVPDSRASVDATGRWKGIGTHMDKVLLNASGEGLANKKPKPTPVMARYGGEALIPS